MQDVNTYALDAAARTLYGENASIALHMLYQAIDAAYEQGREDAGDKDGFKDGFNAGYDAGIEVAKSDSEQPEFFGDDSDVNFGEMRDAVEVKAQLYSLPSDEMRRVPLWGAVNDFLYEKVSNNSEAMADEFMRAWLGKIGATA